MALSEIRGWNHLMNELEYQAVEIRCQLGGIGQSLRVPGKGSNRDQDINSFNIIIDIFCVQSTEQAPVRGPKSTEMSKTSCGRHITPSSWVIMHSLPHATI